MGQAGGDVERFLVVFLRFDIAFFYYCLLVLDVVLLCLVQLFVILFLQL